MTSKILKADSTVISNIKSVIYTETVNAGEGLRPGCVASAYIEVECFGAQSNAPSAGEALTYYQVDGNGTETLIGVFYAEPSIPTKKTFKFTAYDAVSKLDKPYSERLNAIQTNFPMTIYALVSDACNVAGVTLGSASWPLSTQTVQAFYVDGLTCRNILQYAAELAGKFVRADSSGEVVFDWYTTASTGIKPGAATGYVPYKQDGLTYDNYTVLACDAVAIKPSGTEGAAYIYPTTYGTVTATDPNGDGNVILTNLVVTDDGSGNLYLGVGAEDDNSDGNVEITESASASNTLILSWNLLLTNATEAAYTAAAQNIYNVMSALPAYRHATVNLFTFMNPFRAGQFVSITDAQGVSFTAPIFEMRVQASGAEIKSSGKESYAESEQTTVAKALANLANNIVQIDKLKVGYAEIDELIANWIRTGKITVEDANGTVIFNADAGENEVEIGQFEVTDEGFVYPSESSGWAIPYKVIITKYGDAAFKSRIVGHELIVMNNSQSPYYASITTGGARYFSGGTAYYNPSNGIITVNGGTLHRSITNSNVYIPDENDSRGAREVGGTEIWKNLVIGDGEHGDLEDPGNIGNLVFTGGLYHMAARQGVYSPFVFRDVLAEIDDLGNATADSDWQELTLDSSFEEYTSGSPVKYRKVGSTVEVRGVVKPTAQIAAGGTATIGTLQSGYRPDTTRYFVCHGSDQNIWLLYINSSGVLTFSRYGGDAAAAVPTTAWLPFNAMFFTD